MHAYWSLSAVEIAQTRTARQHTHACCAAAASSMHGHEQHSIAIEKGRHALARNQMQKMQLLAVAGKLQRCLSAASGGFIVLVSRAR
jgi:hypothetical protein